METEEDTSNRQTANNSGFFSGFASATTLRREEPVSGLDCNEGNILESMLDRSFGEG